MGVKFMIISSKIVWSDQYVIILHRIYIYILISRSYQNPRILVYRQKSRIGTKQWWFNKAIAWTSAYPILSIDKSVWADFSWGPVWATCLKTASLLALVTPFCSEIHQWTCRHQISQSSHCVAGIATSWVIVQRVYLPHFIYIIIPLASRDFCFCSFLTHFSSKPVLNHHNMGDVTCVPIQVISVQCSVYFCFCTSFTDCPSIRQSSCTVLHLQKARLIYKHTHSMVYTTWI